ncbi:MAG TPA: CBS domain-containing protein, partial [Kofleriaceae bacterium]|nr:CBS domain-containing protein [Kofleriaceae bacterium]
RAFPLAPPLLHDDEELDDRPAPVRARTRPSSAEPASAEAAALASRAMACGVDQIMRPRPPTVLEDAPVTVLRDLLLERRARAVPVVDRDGRPVGVVTAADLLRGDGATAADVMSPHVLALPITAILAQAAALIAYEGVSEIIIADLHGRVAGLLGALDITRWCARAAGYLVDH